MHNIFRLRLGICVHLFAVMVGPGNLFLYVHTCVCNILCRIVSAYRMFLLSFCAARGLRKSPQDLLAILQGKITVSANLRSSPQNFHEKCADKCQNPGSQKALDSERSFRSGWNALRGAPEAGGP